MKRLLIFILVAVPILAQSQTVIDRAMSVWSRDIVNDNFTTTFDSTAANRANIVISATDIATNVSGIAVNVADIDTLESQIDSSLVVFDYRDSTILNLNYLVSDSINSPLIRSVNVYVDSTIVADSISTRVLNYNPPHGVMAFADSALTLDLTQNIWSKITNDQDSLFAILDAVGITVDGDSMTIITPGDYLMLVNASFDGNANDRYHMAIYVNSVITRFESHRKTSNNDTGYFGIFGYLDDLKAGDNVCIKIQNTVNNNDPTFVSSQVILDLIRSK